MGYFLQFGYRKLRTVVRDSLYCILSMYIYMYMYNTVLVNKVGGFHMADRGTELRTLFPPQTCLVNSSFCYIFCLPKFPSCSHFVSILTRVIHVLCTHSSWASIPQERTHVRTEQKDTWKIKIQKISKSGMLCDDGITYSKQLMKYPDSHPFLIRGTGKPHVGRKAEHTRAG